MRQTVAALAIVGIVPLAGLAVSAPGLFAFVFGHRWRIAGELAQPLCMLAAAQLVVSPLLQTFAVLARLELQARLAVMQLTLTLGPLVAAHAEGASPTAAVTALSFGATSAYLLNLIAIDRIADSPT